MPDLLLTVLTMAQSSARDGNETPKQSAEIIKIENAEVTVEDVFLQRYPLLASKSKEELDTLNKAVLSKLDWRFLPCITAMLLMKWVALS